MNRDAKVTKAVCKKAFFGNDLGLCQSCDIALDGTETLDTFMSTIENSCNIVSVNEQNDNVIVSYYRKNSDRLEELTLTHV